MLEFYQAYSDYRDLMDLSQEMITRIAEAVTGARQVQYGPHLIDFDRWQRVSMKEAILRFWPDSAAAPSEQDLLSADKLRSLAESIHAPFEPSDGPGKLLAALFESVVSTVCEYISRTGDLSFLVMVSCETSADWTLRQSWEALRTDSTAT